MIIGVALILLSMNQYFALAQRCLTHFFRINIESNLILVRVMPSIYQSTLQTPCPRGHGYKVMNGHRTPTIPSFLLLNSISLTSDLHSWEHHYLTRPEGCQDSPGLLATKRMATHPPSSSPTVLRIGGSTKLNFFGSLLAL